MTVFATMAFIPIRHGYTYTIGLMITMTDRVFLVASSKEDSCNILAGETSNLFKHLDHFSPHGRVWKLPQSSLHIIEQMPGLTRGGDDHADRGM